MAVTSERSVATWVMAQDATVIVSDLPDDVRFRHADGSPVTSRKRIPRPVPAVYVRLRLPSGALHAVRLEK